MAAKTKPAKASLLPETCSATQLSEILGLSRRNVLDWANRGVLVKAGAGRYRTVESIHAYIAHLRESAAGRATTKGVTLADERAMLTATQRQIQELKLAQLKGDVLTLEEVAESWSEFATSVKGMVLALPGKARQTIPHLTAHDGETLKRICRDSLTELAQEVAAVVIGADEDKLKDGE